MYVMKLDRSVKDSVSQTIVILMLVNTPYKRVGLVAEIQFHSPRDSFHGPRKSSLNCRKPLRNSYSSTSGDAGRSTSFRFDFSSTSGEAGRKTPFSLATYSEDSKRRASLFFSSTFGEVRGPNSSRLSFSSTSGDAGRAT